MLQLISRPPLSQPGYASARSTTLSMAEVPPEPRTVDDLIRLCTTSYPNAPLVGYPSSNKPDADYKFHTPSQLDVFANGAVSCMVSNGLEPNTRSGDKVVALLASSNLDYIVAIFALLKLRCSVLLLSTRLATEAYTNLLDKTNCENLFVSANSTLDVAAIVDSRPQTTVHYIPTSSEYSQRSHHSPTLPAEDKNASNRTAFIIHSSGSTGLPKPIFQTHGACLANYGTGNGFKAFLTLPLFHNHGLATFFRAVCTGTPVALFNAELPMTTDTLLNAMEKVEPQSFHGVPYALKLLSQSERGIELLVKCKLVMFGGSSCPDDIGDGLVERGVYLVAHYGATEMGQLMTSFRPDDDRAWNYVRPFPAVAPYLHFAPREEGLYECVVLDGLKSKVATNSNEPPNSFHTSDLFLKHPTIPNAWKYVSRNDDRINLVNGEKVLPIHYENRLRQDPLIREALLFGAGKQLPGLFLIPSEEGRDLHKEAFLDAVWPTIVDANSKAEKFAQISREMVDVLPWDVQYPVTDKGTLIRARSYKQFADQIERVYQRFDGDEEITMNKNNTFSTKDFLRQEISQRTGLDKLDDNTDFFSAGIDSLQNITIRAAIKRHSKLKNDQLSTNVIFEYPTINKLADHVDDLLQGRTTRRETEIEAMQDLITKYSSFNPFKPVKQEYVLLTGATGSLGAHVLSQLLQQPQVIKIYCLVRSPTPSEGLDRILQTLQSKGLPTTHNIMKITALPSDMSKPDLGLPEPILSEIKSHLTKVIHSAWAVNFNLPVRRFQDQHITGLHHLLNLCLSTLSPQPAELYFCSSISAAAGTPIPASIPERPIPELAHAQDMGYARSKLVAERIVQAAAEKTGMVARVLRIGQIIGDTAQGVWNTTEAIPLMLQGAVTLGALPALEETPSWLPVDVVARGCLELSGLVGKTGVEGALERVSEGEGVVYQLCNSETFHWTEELLPALREAGFQFETVSRREWVRRLRESDEDVGRNPTRKLLDFFERKYDNDGPARKGLVFETAVTESVCPVLKGGFDVIGSGIVGKIVEDFRRKW